MIDTSQERPVSLPRLGLLACAAALLAALLVAGQTYLSMLHHGHSWWRLFLWQLGSWSFWAALAPWVAKGGSELLKRPRNFRPWVLRHLGSSLGLTAVHLLVSASLTTLLQPFEPVVRFGFRQSLEAQLVPWSYVDLLVYWLLIAIGYALAAALYNRRLEVRESRLEAELARAQLEALRLEIQPHFLFNTLNSVAALVRRKANDQALDMVVGLSELLRATLNRSHRPRVPLEEEMGLVRRYLDLQQARFADRLQVRIHLADECRDLLVPTLLLQPLVENAIRHGIARRAGAGSIDIEATLADGHLRLTVADDGPGLKPGFELAREAGVGLGNTRSRLAQLYGSASRLEVRNGAEAGTVAVVTLPPEVAELTPDEAVG